MNEWYQKLPFWKKKQVCLQTLAGIYYDFYTEDDLMEMFNLDNNYIEKFNYDDYFKRIYEYEEYLNEEMYEY